MEILRNLLRPNFDEKIQKTIHLGINHFIEINLSLKILTQDLILVHKDKLPSLTKIDFLKYTFFPKDINDLGIHVIEGLLKNSYGNLSFTFTVFVENRPPTLTSPPKDITINVLSN